jgi:hypothetical protein
MASKEKRNKTLVLETFNTLRRPRDIGRRTTSCTAPLSRVEKVSSTSSRPVPRPPKCEPGVIVAEGDFVIVHGRFSGTGLPRNW